MSEYIFDQHEVDQELHRLRLIEDVCDPATITHLEATGIRAGWECLELGAGAGSIMNWMAGVVGSNGRVVAVDRNAVHLRSQCSPACEIIGGDFLEVPLPTEFDLAHCRYVLIHNLRSDEMLHGLCDSLKPGGFLVVEEPDFASARLLNPRGSDAQQRVNNAIYRMFTEMELDPAFGLTLPGKVAAEGLRIIEVVAQIHLDRGGSGVARMMAASTAALGDRYVATGEADALDIDAYLQNCADETFWAAYYSTVSVVARK